MDAFNRKSQKDSFVFLLSAKAGGVGLNLIGYDVLEPIAPPESLTVPTELPVWCYLTVTG